METQDTTLEITEAAGAYLAQLLEEHRSGDTVRFVFGLQGMQPQPSVVLPGDLVYEYAGKTVLVLDPTVARMLANRTLDVENTDEGPILRLS